MFFESCDRGYEFSSRWATSTVDPQEQELLVLLRDCGLSIEQKISILSKEQDWGDFYALVIFSVRLAILAVRKRQPSTYLTGLVALVAGSPKVDWRDVLVAFAIFDDCGNRLGVDFQTEVELVAVWWRRNSTSIHNDGFFSRDAIMRRVDVMGFEECGVCETLTYRSKRMF